MINELDIKYRLIVEVDGKVVFLSDYLDTYELQEDLGKAEMAVQEELEAREDE